MVQVGNLAWVSGQIPLHEGNPVSPGLVDSEVDVPHAQAAARQAALQGLSALVDTLGGLDRIQKVVRVTVYVASSPGFVRQHEVANGATGVLLELLGEPGRPSRAAVGVSRLPMNASVEVDLLVALRSQ